MAREHLIVALDFPSAATALQVVEQLDGLCLWYKVGLQLFLAAGLPIVERLAARNLKVFLDLKLHDIPNTVAGAVRSVSSCGASLLTVHAGGGSEMLQSAVGAAGASSPRLDLLAVTVLTSMDRSGLTEIGVPSAPEAQVLRLGRLALNAGIQGLVCSAVEITTLRSEFGPNPLIVVPGIRPAGAETGDQRRTATPGTAIALGASKLVVGRPITHAKDPSAAAQAILAEIETSLRRTPA